MYIKKIVIENIRCFEHVEIDLSSQQGAKMWTLLLGDNGVGKTTILRCIAMALMRSRNASGLLDELYGEWVRGKANEPETAFVYIEFEKSASNQEPRWIKTIFKKEKSGYIDILQETSSGEVENFPWDEIFVCGYGAARRAFGSKDYSEYSAVDSLYTLFNYDAVLQNSELIFRRLKDHVSSDIQAILKWLDNILMLPEGSTNLSKEGITINGPWGNSMLLGALGDGHQATIAWISDMLGWMMFYDEKVFKKGKEELSGIILLDEIEHHLHPGWQKQIIKLLSVQFPNLQFIATTHSPLCAIGSANLPDDKCSLVLLTQADDHVTARDKLVPPHGRRADQVLSSYLFGLDTTRSDDSAQRIERYSNLISKKTLTEKEQKELSDLRSQLNEVLGSGETVLQRLVEKAVHESLEKLVANLSSEELPPPQEAIDFEVKRLLKDLFGKKHD